MTDMEHIEIKRNDKLIQQKYREYLIPSVMTSAALSLASVVDAAIVGNLLGSKELAGIGACTPVIAIINALMCLFMVGGITKASIALGERKKDQADKYFSITMIVGMTVAIAFVVLTEHFAEPVSLLLSGNKPELAGMVIKYYRPIVFAYPALMISMVAAQFMRVDGHPKMASNVALVSNAINLVLDYVFIRFFGMGLAGASLSTVLGYVFGSSLLLTWVFSKKRSFHIVNPFKTEFFVNLKAVLGAGSSECFMNVSDFFKRILLNMIVLYYLGGPGLSVLTVCNSVQFFGRYILKGAGDAFLPIVGSLFGAKDYYGIRKCVDKALKFVGVTSAVIVIIMVAVPEFVGGLFGLAKGETAEIAGFAIRMLALSFPFAGINITLQTLYNTTGRAKLSTTISILDGVAYICLCAFLLPMIAPSLFWVSFVTAETLVLITAIVIGLYIKNKEKTKGYQLLKPLPDDIILRSYTIEAIPEAAVLLSEKMQKDGEQLGIESGLANRIALAVEEMTMAVCLSSEDMKKRPIIDISLEKNKEETVLSFRENGKPVNLLIEDPDKPTEASDGIKVLKCIAKTVEYSRQLGFNTVVIKF